mmetsp:Transcript_28655/g.90418  ORF Transcript_28655/g.90418 Transcript_28655/m.90418 type:complete len:874 (+) Transcript_28655:93-2714(+)
MSAGPPPDDAALQQRQAALLDELAACLSGGGDATASAAPARAGAGGPAEADAPFESEEHAFEVFHEHWRRVKARQRQVGEKQRRTRWRWIDQVQEICSETCRELDSLLAALTELDEKRQEVVRKTTALHEQCEQMVQDQEQLSSSTEALAERLDFFDRVADVARVLDQGSVTIQQPDVFASTLDQLDGSIAFLESHPDFCQAQAYSHQFEHLRNRACISIRSVLQKSLEKSLSQVEQQLRERTADGSVDTQVLYTRFRAAALNYRPLMSLLHRRMEVHETYAVTLEELEGFYVTLRIRLVAVPVTLHLQSVLHKDFEMSQLAPATRQASTYILDISHFERQCFEAYFEPRQPQEALRTLLEAVADVFYKILRPVVLSCDSVDWLREMADCLQMDILEPHQQAKGSSDPVPVLAVVFRLHKDVQEKLIYRVETYIRQDIKGYQISPADLNYPGILLSVDPTASREQDGGTAADLQHGWFPTMQRTLSILAKIYRVLEMSTFQGLAQEAVDLCMASLKQASQLLAHRQLPDRSNALAPLVQMMDSQLFLVKHLLILREQVAAFECDLVVNEKYFNFSNVWEALHLKLPDGLLGILKPKLCQSQVDSKKDIEAELKAACESLITNLTAHITQPLATLNTQIGDFLATPGTDRSRLKDQSFMALDRLRDVIGAFLANVRERVPFAAAHIRLYLASSGGSSSGGGAPVSQSTASILFKPVQIRLVDTWGRLDSLLQERQLSSDELQGLGFVGPDALRELVSSLFQGVMEAPWSELVEMVCKVPRPTPVQAPDQPGGPPPHQAASLPTGAPPGNAASTSGAGDGASPGASGGLPVAPVLAGAGQAVAVAPAEGHAPPQPPPLAAVSEAPAAAAGTASLT